MSGVKNPQTQMPHAELDTVDLCLSLHVNGWSSCTWVVNEICHTSHITHVIGEPYAAFIQALEQIIEGQPKVTFQWYNEPGAELFVLTKTGEWLDVQQKRLEGEDGSPVHDCEVGFTTTERTFLTIGYLQLKKTALLMKDRRFAVGRQGNFPFQQFYEFEVKAREYLGF